MLVPRNPSKGLVVPDGIPTGNVRACTFRFNRNRNRSSVFRLKLHFNRSGNLCSGEDDVHVICPIGVRVHSFHTDVVRSPSSSKLDFTAVSSHGCILARIWIKTVSEYHIKGSDFLERTLKARCFTNWRSKIFNQRKAGLQFEPIRVPYKSGG